MSGFAEGTPTETITLGGKPYTLAWTWGAKRRVRDYLTQKYGDSQKAGEEENLAAILWASMNEEDRKATSVEQVEDMVNPVNELDVAAKISALCIRSEPEVKAEPAAVKEKPLTAGNPTNSNESGRLAAMT